MPFIDLFSNERVHKRKILGFSKSRAFADDDLNAAELIRRDFFWKKKGKHFQEKEKMLVLGIIPLF